MGLLPKRETSHPDKGRLNIKPAGSEKSTPPSPASLKFNFAWIAGMRLAQVEKISPSIKKKTLVAILYFLKMTALLELISCK
jgi:hypothetical protein